MIESVEELWSDYVVSKSFYYVYVLELKRRCPLQDMKKSIRNLISVLHITCPARAHASLQFHISYVLQTPLEISS